MMLKRAAFLVAITLTSLVICLGLLTDRARAAESAGEFLKSLEGHYRGRGSAEITPGRPAERVACQVSNRYDAKASALVVEGNCASTQGKSKVDGRITHQGNDVSGMLISSLDASVTKSTGYMKDDRLRVFTSFVENVTKKLTRTLQVISHADNGYEADFYVFDNKSGKYEKSGHMSFSRTN